jgi:hypothetical protein
MQRYFAWRGFSPPNEDTAREQCLRQVVAAPDLATVNDFLRFYTAASRPQLDEKRSTSESINTEAE